MRLSTLFHSYRLHRFSGLFNELAYAEEEEHGHRFLQLRVRGAQAQDLTRVQAIAHVLDRQHEIGELHGLAVLVPDSRPGTPLSRLLYCEE